MTDFLAAVRRDGAALVVSGQTGVGRSHLLRAAGMSATASTMAVHASSGVPQEAGWRFAGLGQLLLPMRHDFVHLGPAHRELLDSALGLGHDDGEVITDVAAVAEAVTSLVDWLTRDEPALLAVDDLQWLDPASWAVIATVARSVAGTRAGLLMSVCTDSPASLDLTGLPTCHLEPLTDVAALDLVEARFPGLGGPLRDRVIAEADGNPLVLSELPRSLDQYRRSPGTPLPEGLPINGRLSSAFGPRLAALPSSSRGLLLLAALALDPAEDAGQTVPLTLEPGEQEQLAPALAAGLVTVDGSSSQVTFPHPLIRTTVAALSTSAERREAHRRLAERDSTHERRVLHRASISLASDEHLALELETAARRRLREGNVFGAVEVMRRSAELTPRGSDRARRMAEASCIGSDLAGNLLTAGYLMTQAREIDPQTGDSLQIVVAEARTLLDVEGEVDRAHRLLVSRVRGGAHGAGYDKHALCEALYLLVDICSHGVRPDLSRPLRAALERLGDDAPPALVALSGLLTSSETRTPAGAATIKAVVDAMADTTDHATLGRTSPLAATTDQVSSVRGSLWQVVEAGRAGGACSPVVKAWAALAVDSYLGGRWDESIFIAGQGEAYSNRHDHQLASRGFQLDHALVAAARGRDAVVDDVTAGVGRWAASRGAVLLQLRCHRIRALSAVGNGDFEEAYQHARAVSCSTRHLQFTPVTVEVTLDLVEAAVRTNRLSVARDHLRAIQAADVGAWSPRLAMIAAAARAMADGEGAADHFEAALAVRGVERWPFDLARVQLSYGERLRRMRAPAQSRAHLDAALGAFTRLGAVRWTARARKELDATAIRKGGGNTFGPVSLTPQEREVALLAATGLTNKGIAERLFISPRTVGAHLSHVFPKLGITTRAALRDALQVRPLERV